MVLETEQPLVAYDWCGSEINVGTRVIWHNGKWGLGSVETISRSSYSDEVYLGVRWEAREKHWDQGRIGKVSYSVRPDNCTVWPVQDEDERE